ncbi:T9SS type A sorting domain-containing protein [Psychroserpens sp. SPM9]|uniref:T9SS type A sorting domain-containing protein n=1 Tax=Psychroserpens sp. SPM9 TaxID=2975598 RepID=UPI0021A4DDED|nr:T9SS type A sorting domain-containing protein [Psychroserpens sp. SPM9]MDG5490066.1 T9SS type A sorting domain-containing protein [Psychroserpens sp. SPM9]
MKKITCITLLLILPLLSMGQTFDFNTAEGWTGVQSTLVENGSTVTISFDADTDPKLRHLAANVTDPVTNGIIGITLKNNSSATEFRFVYQNLQAGSGTSGTVIPISANDTEFQTYYIDLSGQDKWDNAGAGGTQNEIDFAFREPGGTSGDNSIDAAGSIEIDQIIFVDVQPRPEKLAYEFNTPGDDEGFSNLVDASTDVSGGNLVITPDGGAIAKVTNGVNSVNAGANSHMHIVYKNESPTNNQLRIQFRSTFDNYAGFFGTNTSINSGMTDFETISLDLATIRTEWVGTAQDFQLAIRNTNNGGNASNADGDFVVDRIIFNNNTTLSLDDLSFSNVSIFPNPANTVVNIKGFNNLSKVQLFDVLGKKVFESNQLSNNQVDVSTFKPGIYVLRLADTNNNIMVKKLIIK